LNEQPGSDWASAGAILRSDEFKRILTTRLVQIAFDPNAGSSSAIRAIEMLLGVSRDLVATGLEGVSTEELEMAERRAEAWLAGLGDGSDS